MFRFQAADVDPPVADAEMKEEESVEENIEAARENNNDATPAATEVSTRRVLFEHGKVRVS